MEEVRPKMIDISGKKETYRKTIASCEITMKAQTLELINSLKTKKGDVLSVATISGIYAAKKTGELIMLAHPLNIEGAEIGFSFKENGIIIEASVWLYGKTGPEMEALTACALSALNIYDMCKAVDKEMVISNLRLILKEGGKSELGKMVAG